MNTWKIHKRKTDIISTVLKNRSLNNPQKIDEFLHPKSPQEITLQQLGIPQTQVNKILNRIKTAIKANQPIVVYGDYDADGICATATLWETLYQLTKHVIPFIPHRQTHGYGLSIKGIDEILSSHKPPRIAEQSSLRGKQATSHKLLIITVDNGIVAHKAVEYANKQGIDVIITDHHVPSKTTPPALAIFHSTQLAGAGVAWCLSQIISHEFNRPSVENLELATIGSVADMVPLQGLNRSLVKHGLQKLANSQRIGLQALFQAASLNISAHPVGTYEINFVIAPRLNAMGRIGHALDSLRLLCTKNAKKAQELAQSVSTMNEDRKQLTEDQLLHAKEIIGETTDSKILIVSHESYHEGVIGLIAGKLVETYWRPAIVLSLGESISKASARSIPGFNIIKALRAMSHHLVDAGGHPMAAGFTIETSKITAFTAELQQLAEQQITDDLLQKSLDIDCEISLDEITWQLYDQLEQLAPFGIGNSRPVFATKNAEVIEARGVGQDKKHLKLAVRQNGNTFSGIGFNLGDHAPKLTTGDHADIAYTIDKNEWNGNSELQLKITDLVY